MYYVRTTVRDTIWEERFDSSGSLQVWRNSVLPESLDTVQVFKSKISILRIDWSKLNGATFTIPENKYNMHKLFFFFLFIPNVLNAQYKSVDSIRAYIESNILNNLIDTQQVNFAVIESGIKRIVFNTENSYGYVPAPAVVSMVNDVSITQIIKEYILKGSFRIDSLYVLDSSLCNGCDYIVNPFSGMPSYERYVYVKIGDPIETYSSFFYLMDSVYTSFKMDTIALSFPVSFYQTDVRFPTKHFIFTYKIYLKNNMYYAVLSRQYFLEDGNLRDW